MSLDDRVQYDLTRRDQCERPAEGAQTRESHGREAGVSNGDYPFYDLFFKGVCRQLGKKET